MYARNKLLNTTIAVFLFALKTILFNIVPLKTHTFFRETRFMYWNSFEGTDFKKKTSKVSDMFL